MEIGVFKFVKVMRAALIPAGEPTLKSVVTFANF